MRAILEFNLPDDIYEYELAMQAVKYKAVIDSFGEKIRAHVKYDKDVKDGTISVEIISEEWYRCLADELGV
jgi:hypothetical protein